MLLMLQIIATMQMFIESFVLTNQGGGSGTTPLSVVMLIYQYAFAMSGASNYNSASALGVVLMLVLAVFSGGFLWATRQRGLAWLPGRKLNGPDRWRDAGNRTLISSVQLNRRRGRIVYRVVLTVVLVAFTLAFIGPLYFLFTDGLKSTQEAIATPPTLYPHHVYPGNYLAAWNRLDIGRMLWNTALLRVRRAGVPAGLRRRRRLLAVQAAPVPGERDLLRDARHADDPGHGARGAAVRNDRRPADLGREPGRARRRRSGCPRVANAFNIFLLKRFFDSIPTEYIDAAQIDGASRLTILLRIVLPISRPIIGVVSIFGLVAVWKDFLGRCWSNTGTPLTRETLNVGIWQAYQGTPQNLLIAASAMAAIPTIVFFLIFQRNIMAGLTAGGIRG